MKRILCYSVICCILLAAFVPSAFCVAESTETQRFLSIIEQLDAKYGVETFDTGAIVTLINEAETLSREEIVIAECTRDVLDKVPVYRLRSDRDVTKKSLKDKVKSYLYVRFPDNEERAYASREWDAVLASYERALTDIEASSDLASMQAVYDAFFDAIRDLPVYSQVYSAWQSRFDKVVNARVDVLVDKVNVYREAQGLAALQAPYFSASSALECTEAFEAFTAGALEDDAAVNAAFRQAVNDSTQLGMYAEEDAIAAQWATFDACVQAAVPTADAGEISLAKAKKEAVATLRQAIDDSAYIRTLTGTDYAFYRALPALMEEQLRDVDNEQDVQVMLREYTALLEPEAVVKPKNKPNTLVVMIIVMASVSVLLFVLYFILRARTAKDVKTDKKGADEMLKELQSLVDNATTASEAAVGTDETADGIDETADSSEPSDDVPSGQESDTSPAPSDNSSLAREEKADDDEMITQDNQDIGDAG